MLLEKIVTTCGRMGEVGEMACFDDCAMNGLHSIFSYHKVLPGETLPKAEDGICDIAVLDMHHGWPNLGHNSIVQAVREAACDFEPAIRKAHLRVRVFSFDVRQQGLLPDPPGGRFSIYLGTGGPGHLDPRMNDGVAEYSQGVKEDPSWEARAFEVVRRHPRGLERVSGGGLPLVRRLVPMVGHRPTGRAGSPRRAARARASSRTR